MIMHTDRKSSFFWSDKRVIVTGGAGFLGNYVIEKLKKRGADNIIIPRIEEYDLTEIESINRLFDDHDIHRSEKAEQKEPYAVQK